MSVLSSVKMEFAFHIMTTSEDHRDIKPQRETGLKIYSASCPIASLREICYQKTRSSDFCKYFIIYLVDIWLFIYAYGFIACTFNSQFQSILVDFIHCSVEPHSNECLFRNNVNCLSL